MREIKFRAWDKELKRFFYGNTDPAVIQCIIFGNPRYEGNQYADLLDKNGREIYEGDILRGAGIVTWNQEDARWSCIDIEWNDKREVHDMLYLTTPLEVIGNIYENPDLLEEKI